MNDIRPSVTFWGGVGAVTGANFLVSSFKTTFLVDCGMMQGLPQTEMLNKEDFPYDPKKIDCLFVTHAHIDHIGRIPKLVRDGFRGKIFSTQETKSLSELMLADATRIMDNKSRESGTLSLYDKKDVDTTLSLWQAVAYHKNILISEDLSVELFDAGHILGSSMFLFSIFDGNKKIKILFTGDLGNSPSTLLRDTEFVNDADYIVMDSVYGDRNHESKEERERRFKKIILDGIERKGAILIPSFSLERTQTILYEINNLIEGGYIRSIPVFLDSPLAIELTNIYEKISSLYNKSVQDDISSGDKIFEFPKLKMTAKVEDSKKIHLTPDPKIIIAGSGMSTAGRILHHESRYLSDPNATIILLGYQAVGTLGRELENNAKSVIINGKNIEIRAKIERINGYSGHKDSQGLLNFVEKSSESGKLKKIFVVMGEPKSSLFIAQRVHDYLNIDAILPEKGKIYPL